MQHPRSIARGGMSVKQKRAEYKAITSKKEKGDSSAKMRINPTDHESKAGESGRDGVRGEERDWSFEG